jgi:hypothetical protein
MAENLWGDSLDLNVLPIAPVALLKQQGSFLASATKGLLRASISTQVLGDSVYLGFSIEAQALTITA